MAVLDQVVAMMLRSLSQTVSKPQRCLGLIFMKGMCLLHLTYHCFMYNYYASCSNEDGAGFYWTPGRRLPFGPSSDPSSQFCHDVRDYGSAGVESANSSASASIERLFSSLENTLDSKLSNLCEKVDNMTSRMQLLEKRQEALEEEIRLSSPSVSSSPVTTPGSGNRRRRTPVALQVT